jgi:uncharacterized membrane protein YeaQ/YmgE (transglycosylase-associated protein family)
MSFFTQALICIVSQVPGLAAHWYRRNGRMGIRLQLVMGTTGACAAAVALAAWGWIARGFNDGTLGWFPVIAVGIVAAFLLVSGAHTLVYALRNPAPPALPDNVIAFMRPAEAPKNLHRYRRRFDG